jgi:hypothetical protein
MELVKLVCRDGEVQVVIVAATLELDGVLE